MENKVFTAIRPEIKAAAVLACLATLAAQYFFNTPLPFFLLRVKEIVLTALILGSAGGVGVRLLRTGLRESSLTPWETLLFAETLGLGTLSLAMVLLGTFHAWTPAGGWALMAAGVGVSGPFLRLLQALSPRTPEAVAVSRERLLPTAALTAACLTTFVLAFSPVTYYDSLVYHFALPAAYLRAHHWLPLTHLIYSAFPQTLEMLWTLGLLIGDDAVANLIAWSLSLLLLGAVIAYAKRFLDASVGWVAAALLSLMPAFLLLSSGGYVDIGLILFSFMAFYAACLWKNRSSDSLVIYAGLFAGWAVGTKYTGALPTLLTAALIAMPKDVIASDLPIGRQERSNLSSLSLVDRLLRRYAPRNDTFKNLCIYGASALLAFSPWLIKNMLFVGNPVFPFLRQWGLKGMNPWLNQAAEGYFFGITEYYARSFLQLPGLLWEAAVNGLGFGRGIDVLGDYGWLPILGFLPALWLCAKRPPILTRLLLYSGAFFIPWAMSHPVLRFLLPVAPILSLLTAYAWVHGIRTQHRAVQWAGRGFMASFLLSGLFLFFYITGYLGSFDVPLGREGRAAYLARKLDYYNAAAFVNSNLPPESVVYVVGDQRGYYYERTAWISPAFSKNPLVEWANAAATAQALHDRLRQAGITHVLFNRAEFERLKSYRYSSFDARGQRNWERLRSRLLKPLYQDAACDIYAL